MSAMRMKRIRMIRKMTMLRFILAVCVWWRWRWSGDKVSVGEGSSRVGWVSVVVRALGVWIVLEHLPAESEDA